ncbi:MAG: GrpB family protein [Bacillota bacterium]|nr:GrpB family protein [Bacillota bacterium]
MSEIPVVIVDYDPAWPILFNTLKSSVEVALGEVALSIEHVGSTSVPGLAAKPIIDMDVVVRAEDLGKAIALLATIGYVHDGDGDIPGRERFRHPAGLPSHHLYVCAEDNTELKRHLQFRDYLRDHPDATAEYGALKKGLAATFGDDREGYSIAKTEFITTILSRCS